MRTQPSSWHLTRAGILPLALLPCLITGCQFGASSSGGQAKTTTPASVQAARASMQTWPGILLVQGQVAADEHAVVGARAAGLVDEVKIDLGSVVKEGDILAVIRTEDLELRVRQAEAQVQQTRATLGLTVGASEENIDPEKAPLVREELANLGDARDKLNRGLSLHRSGAISIEEVQVLQASRKVAEARYQSSLNKVQEQIALLGVHNAALALARQHFEDASIRAPFNGIVEHRHVAPGVYLQTGDPVVTLVRTDPLRFRGGVPERHASQVRLGQMVRVQIEGAEKTLTGKIDRISPALDLASRSLTIEVTLPNPQSRLQTGLFAEAEIVVAPDAQALAVPSTAVTDFAGVEKVWVIEDGQAREVRVRTGRHESAFVEIVEGLSPGSLIAVNAKRTRPGPVAVVASGQPNGAE